MRIRGRGVAVVVVGTVCCFHVSDLSLGRSVYCTTLLALYPHAGTSSYKQVIAMSGDSGGLWLGFQISLSCRGGKKSVTPISSLYNTFPDSL